MPTYLSPSAYIEELAGPVERPEDAWSGDCSQLPGDLRRIEMVGAGTAAFIGITERAETMRNGQSISLLGRPHLVSSWEQFVECFGGPIPGAYLPDSVHGFFANGGKRCYILSLSIQSTDGMNLSNLRGSHEQRTGIAGLETLDDITLICAPDIMTAYETGILDLKGVQALQWTLIDFCELQHYPIAILDTPSGLTPQQVRDWRFEMNYDTTRAAVYYPWLENEGRKIPPCGHIAGIYVRTYESKGAHYAPANEGVRDAGGLEIQVTKGEQDALNPVGINILRIFPDGWVRVWGARTLTVDQPSLRYVKFRLLLNMIERSLGEGTTWAIFQQYDSAMRKQICCALYDFLERIWRTGALVGDTAEQAFYLKDYIERSGSQQYVVDLGFAFYRAREFIPIRIVFFPDDVIHDIPAVETVEEAARPEPLPVEEEKLPATGQPQIFLSYSRQDWNQYVEPLAKMLRDNGFTVWVDQRLLRSGEDWMDQINDALSGCPVMVLCVSPDAMSSRYVKYEYRYFFTEDKPIVPVICREASLPAELRGIQYLTYGQHDTLVERLRELLW